MRARILGIIISVFMIVLLAGVGFVQIISHEKYKVMSEENRLKIVPLVAPRGTIFDRSGLPIVKDSLCFDIAIVYARIKDKEKVVNELSYIIDIPAEDLLKKINGGKKYPYSSIIIASDVGIDKGILIEELDLSNDGVSLEVSSKREYLYGKLGANFLGYIGLINRSEFDKLKHYGYQINDFVGRDGIEKNYDEYLRGKHGGKQIEVDHMGREADVLGYKEPVPGKNIGLTIELELQKFCEKELEGKRGTIIVMDPNTGKIFVMANSPTYDPGIFVDEERSSERTETLKDATYPMLNRAIAGVYPPGSVFKVIVAIAGLEEGAININTPFFCNGEIVLGKRVFHCWRKSGHGEQILAEAIKNSCNVFFWRLGLKLGVDNISEYAKRFGIGAKTGIDLPGEKQGLLPTREWKRKTSGESWYLGETMNYSVGQGYLLCSPIQIVRVISVFANKGFLVRPYLVDKVDEVVVNTPKRINIGITLEDIQEVREGLKKVVNDKHGTGIKAKNNDIVVAGKTGTAQTSKGMNHGWFAGFAPYDNPSIAIVVFDEYGGKGGYFAAGTAGRVIEKARELGIV